MSNRTGGATAYHMDGGRGGGRGRGRGRGVAQSPFHPRQEEGLEKAEDKGLTILTETIIKEESGRRDELDAVMEIAELKWPHNPQTKENTVEVEDSSGDENVRKFR